MGKYQILCRRRGDPSLLLSLKTQGGVEKWLFTPVYWYDVRNYGDKATAACCPSAEDCPVPWWQVREEWHQKLYFQYFLKMYEKKSRIWDQNAEVSVKGSRSLCWNQSQMFVGEHGLGWRFHISLSKVGLTQRWLPVGACGSVWQGLLVVLLSGVAAAEGMTLLMEYREKWAGE